MICPGTEEFVTPDFFRDWRRRMISERVPMTGTVELTRQCNLRCIHCYLGDRLGGARDELSSDQWKHLLNQAAEAGCLFLVITGGEPLLRKDFGEIYSHARRLGLLPTFFTNGTLLNDEHMRLFNEMPPRSVEVSLYGASPETYKRMTGSAEAFAGAMRAIVRLRDAGITVYVKTVLTTENEADLPAIRELAESAGCRFRFDAALFPELDGGKGPIAFRVEPEEAVAREFAHEKTAAAWSEYHAKIGESVDTATDLYLCGAGRMSFYLDAAGRMRPCVLAPFSTDAINGGFSAAWQNVGKWVAGIRMAENHPCRGCGIKHLCGYCPAFFTLETANEQEYSTYVCRMGGARLGAIKAAGGL